MPEGGNHVVATGGGRAERVFIGKEVVRLAFAVLLVEAGMAESPVQDQQWFAEELAQCVFPLPYRTCWVEFEQADSRVIYAAFLNAEAGRADFFAGVRREESGLFWMRCLISCDLKMNEGMASLDAVRWQEARVNPALVRRVIGSCVASLSFMTEQTVVSVRKVEGDWRRGRAPLRGTKTSGPVFSHNRVELVLPTEARVIGGEVVLTESGCGVRRHEVGAYWARRGNDKKWTLIKPHPRGNEALGRVVKTKMVKAA